MSMRTFIKLYLNKGSTHDKNKNTNDMFFSHTSDSTLTGQENVNNEISNSVKIN